MHIIRNLAENPGVCISLGVCFFLFGSLLSYLLMDGLLRMHRSKTAVKKLKKEYTFRQRLWLIPHQQHCLHAVFFCKKLIALQRMGWILFGVYLAVCLLFDSAVVWSSVILFVIFDLPIFMLNGLLSRPFIGRFKEYSFAKYHNTDDMSSLM